MSLIFFPLIDLKPFWALYILIFLKSSSLLSLILPESSYTLLIFEVSTKMSLLFGYFSLLKFWLILFIALILNCITHIWLISLVYIYRWSYTDINTHFLFLPTTYTHWNSLDHLLVMFLKIFEMSALVSKYFSEGLWWGQGILETLGIDKWRIWNTHRIIRYSINL